MDEDSTKLFANHFLATAMSSSNLLCNSLLSTIEQRLNNVLPHSTDEISKVFDEYRDMFKASAQLFNKNSTAQTRLPISIKIREGNVEKREGVFATTVRGNIGSRNLEKAARMQKLISTDLNMVEVRRFEADLNEYCTIPSGELPFIEIKPGVKYELVFENMDIFKPHMKSRSPLSDMSPGPAKMDEIPSFSHLFPSQSTSMISTRTKNTPETIVDNRRRPNNHIGSVSRSAATIREMEAHKELPTFNILEVIAEDTRGDTVIKALTTGQVKGNGRLRVMLVQILGKFFNDNIKPQLAVANAATRRAFIDECFNQLATLTNNLPSVEDYSNRMGNGFMDIYLKHQVTRERKRAAAKQAEETYNKLSHLAQNLLDNQYSEDFDIPPMDDLVDEDSQEAQQLKRFNFFNDGLLKAEDC